MKEEIQLARARQDRTAELAAGAQYARRRLAEYHSRESGPKVASPARLRELERASELAETRLRRAQERPPAPGGPAPEDEDPAVRGETDEGVEFG